MKEHPHLISSLGINPLLIQEYLPFIKTIEKYGSTHLRFLFRGLYQTKTSFDESYSDVVFSTTANKDVEGFFYSDINLLPASYTDIFLFRNPIELLSYLQLQKLKSANSNHLFLSFPRSTFSSKHIVKLAGTFKTAKFYCCFEKSPQNDLLSIRLAIATSNREYSIIQKNNSYHFRDKTTNLKFVIANDKISLGQFRKLSSLSKIRCVRTTPPKNFISFNDLLKDKYAYSTQ